jgi:ribosomal protein S18 acetylase RimI-like enzyme
MKIVKADLGYRNDINELIKEQWAGPMIVSKGHVWDTSVLPGFAAIDDNGNFCGAVTFRMSDGEFEIITMNSLKENQGMGTYLLKSMMNIAKHNYCQRLCLITTNDNTKAIRFYQKFGFTLKAVHLNALEKSRELKPAIPLIGRDGIPMLHEFEFEIML